MHGHTYRDADNIIYTTHSYGQTHVKGHTCTQGHTHTQGCTHTHIGTHTLTHMDTHLYIHINMGTHMHTHTESWTHVHNMHTQISSVIPKHSYSYCKCSYMLQSKWIEKCEVSDSKQFAIKNRNNGHHNHMLQYSYIIKVAVLYKLEVSNYFNNLLVSSFL